MRSRIPLLLTLTLSLAPSLAVPAAEEAALPRVIDDARLELHGTFNGERFWARLLVRDPAFGNHRILQLLYTQPKPKELGGTVLVDHPWILLDDHLRVVAWNERREGLSGAQWQDKDGGAYRVSMAYWDGEGDAAVERQRAKKIPAPPAWDVRLAPLLAALAIEAGFDKAAVPGVDLFAVGDDRSRTVTLTPKLMGIGDRQLAIVTDADGRVQRISDGERDLLVVKGWLTGKDGGKQDDGPAPIP